MEQRPDRLQQRVPGVRVQRVVDPLRIPPGANQPDPAQFSKVVGHQRLWEPEVVDQVTDARFGLGEPAEDPEAIAIAQEAQRAGRGIQVVISALFGR